MIWGLFRTPFGLLAVLLIVVALTSMFISNILTVLRVIGFGFVLGLSVDFERWVP